MNRNKLTGKTKAAVILWWLGTMAWVAISIWTFCGHSDEPASPAFMVGTASAIFGPYVVAGILLRWDRDA